MFLHATRVPVAQMEADTEHRHGDHDVVPLNNPRAVNRKAYERSVHRELDEKIKALKRKPVYVKDVDEG